MAHVIDRDRRISDLRLIEEHPLITGTGFAAGAFVDVFGSGRHPQLDTIRDECLTAFTHGVVAVALTPTGDERVVDAVLTTAFGADAASVELRGRLTGARGPRGPVPGGLVVDERIADLVVWGTIRDLTRAMAAHGAAVGSYAAWAARATASATGITGLEPGRGCAGARVTLRGAGFGASRPVHTEVRFPTAPAGCATAEVVSWSDTEIVAAAPPDVGVGCVGFLLMDGDPPNDPYGSYLAMEQAAGMLQSVLGDAFGGKGVVFGQSVVDTVRAARTGFTAGLPCPPCLPPDPATGVPPNRFLGGPPMIRSFTVDGGTGTVVRPGESITLRFEVDNADEVTFTSRTAEGSRWPAVLPPVPTVSVASAGGPGTSGEHVVGPFAIPDDGVDDWDGEYVLEARNACAPEPVSRTVRVERREPEPLFGFADTHVHFANHLAFGGYGVWGRPHAADPALTGDAAMADALPWCDGSRGHGPGGVLPSLEGVGGHLVGGWPAFDGWPKYTTLAHQQAYLDWIRRAVDGGLRLAVCLATNSELVGTRMSEVQGAYLPVDDTSTMIRQLEAVQAMVDLLDTQAGGPGLGWMQIARTPADARRIVAAGNLAVVLGVELDALGGYATPAQLEAAAVAAGSTPEQLVADLVAELHVRGVRHVFPVHGTNNAFGGAALFVREYDAANFFLTGASFVAEAADPALGIAYRIDTDPFGSGISELLAYWGTAALADPAGVAAGDYPLPPAPTNWAGVRGGHINAQGLTEHGVSLVEELMRRGMLIDIDHMGHKTTEGVLDRCEQQGYPVVSGHTGVRALKYGGREITLGPGAEFPADAHAFGTLNPRRLASEVDKSDAQLERIRRLGGMVSAIAYQHHVHDYGGGHGVRNDSSGSSASFAQAWLYVHDAMRGRRVGFGTDINGAGRLPGPRFGPQGSGALTDRVDWQVRPQGRSSREGEVFGQRDGVRYSSPIVDYRHHRYMDYAGHPEQAPFDAEQRDFWEAIAIIASGTEPVAAEQPSVLQRPPATQNFVINLATGLRATSRSEIPIAIPFGFSRPRPIFGENPDVQLAAYLASHPGDAVRADDPRWTRELVPKLAPVWTHWRAMTDGAPAQGSDTWTQDHFGPAGSGLYDATGRLSRSRAGRRDFDVNIDGVAHYGMLPDLMQDLRNIGMQPQTLAAMYRSAEDYIRVWERCEARRLP
jgi:microsomal dipeptidase-like Zn-dependent dipeptidase